MKPETLNRLRPDPETATIYRGHHVVVMDRDGLIASDEQGYYLQQTRFLSRFEVRGNGEKVKGVCCNGIEPYSAVAYYLLPSPAGRKAAPRGDDDPSGGEIVGKGIELQINTYAGGGYHQDIHVTNHALAEATIVLEWAFDADFADLDEVTSGKRRQQAPVHRSFEATGPGRGELTFAYRHPDINHATRIRMTAPGMLADDGERLRTTFSLRPRQAELISIDVAPVFLGESVEPWFGLDGEPTAHYRDAAKLSEEWLTRCTDIEASDPTVQSAWNRAAADLWSLQSLRGEAEQMYTPMAGIPKYTALFGRDALTAGIHSILLNPWTLKGSLLSVGEWTAKAADDRFDAQPGKVLHQRQLSPLALLGKNPFLHYYGDYSAPGLYILGAALHFAHSGDRRAFEAIKDRVCATLDWMDRDGDIDGDGFYEYRTLAGKAGIKNQGWKDSRQAILEADGSFVRDPIAVAEVQGLYYAAKQALACAFQMMGESGRAAELFEQAAALKKRFNARFWMADERFFALALGPDKKQVRTIASNIGSCLGYGIVDEDKAQAVADRMLAPDMFTGWGVRTLSSEHPAYNPLAYHLGTVWPTSNAHLCSGLKRYGFNEALHKVAGAVFDATRIFEFNRLPEVFGGHPRGKRCPHPGVYPVTCSPQAWSAAAVIQICHALTGLTPLAPLDALIVDPALPDWLRELTVRNLRVGHRRVSIAFHRDAAGTTRHEILEGGEGLRVHSVGPNATVGKDRLSIAISDVLAEHRFQRART
ncbi:MAG TPA: glycogen debranching N-terminal domain-containing protein [Roseiarcus sp.]